MSQMLLFLTQYASKNQSYVVDVRGYNMTFFGNRFNMAFTRCKISYRWRNLSIYLNICMIRLENYRCFVKKNLWGWTGEATIGGTAGWEIEIGKRECESDKGKPMPQPTCGVPPSDLPRRVLCCFLWTSHSGNVLRLLVSAATYTRRERNRWGSQRFCWMLQYTGW